VVFTLPEPVAAIAFYNKEVAYTSSSPTAETCSPSPATPNTWAWKSASRTCYIAGVRTFTLSPSTLRGSRGGLSADHDRWFQAPRFSCGKVSVPYSGACCWSFRKSLSAGQLQFFGDRNRYATQPLRPLLAR